MAENQTIIDLLRRANTQLDAQNNEPGGADRPTPGMPSSALEPAMKGTLGAVGDVVGGIMGLPKQFMDASARDVYNLGDHTQPKESAGPAAEIAMNLAGFGAPAAERGAAGIFGGKLGVGADLGKLNKAEMMAADGMLPDAVRYSTGWHRSPADQLWRYEIPDNRSAMKYMPDGEGNKAIGSVESLFAHPDLYRAYPEVRGYSMELARDSSRPGGSGLFDSNAKKLWVNAPDMRTARDVTLHELQHGVQGIEGFSPGANPNYYAGQIEKGLRKNPELGGVYDFDTIKDQANHLYKGTAGEVEARNVQARKDMSAPKRESIHPWMTQDTPYLEQYHFDPVAETVRALRQHR
jgi:Large polyvalent protein associated domain 23